MKEENDTLEKNKTQDLVELPNDRKIVSNKWVFKLKKDVDYKVVKHKARMVAKGYSQNQDSDFQDIISPFVKFVSIRLVLALVALLDLELEQLDVKTYFLHGALDEDIYMEQPKDLFIIAKKDLFENSENQCMV